MSKVSCFFLTLIILLGVGIGLTPQNALSSVVQQVVVEPPSAQTYFSDFQARTIATPLRDEYAIFNRLKSGGQNPNPPRTTSKPAYNLGDQEVFWVHNLQQKNYYQVRASVVAITPHLYMFLDNAYRLNVGALQRVAQLFEEQVYPTTRQYFGEEWSPGVDNDPRIVILNTPLQGAAGYFSSEDELLSLLNPRSNEREIFYVDSRPENTGAYLSLLAHEFQHMINFRTSPGQEIWLNEGMSVLSQVINGYGSGGYEGSFFGRVNTTQLNNWTCTGCGTAAHYGAGFVWVQYLEARFGADTVKNVSNNGQGLVGFNSVDWALAKTVELNLDHTQFFRDWVVANYLNRRTADSKYRYERISQQVNNVGRLQIGANQQATVEQYAAQYFRVQGDQNGFVLDFQGAPTARIADTILPSGSSVWWTNRAENSETHLTREVDLSNVSKATLNFSLWFDIEAQYDYLYIQASEDGGKTWKVLPAKYSVNAAAGGKVYGAGYSGRSSPSGTSLADKDDTQAEWVQDSVDLSLYAGKKIRIRFEYLTDEGYTRQGALLDNIEIPEINWRDDIESDVNGWEATGFFRTNNQVLQRYAVRVIGLDGVCANPTTQDLATAFNGQSCIRDLDLNEVNYGRANFPFREAVVVVAPYAVKTIVPAPFTLKVERP